MTGSATATAPLSWQREDTLGNYERLTAAALGGFSAASDLAACVVPLLSALGWRGNPRHVAEALPHFATTLDLTGLRNVMANLGYASRPRKTALADIDPRLLPCLYLPDNGAAMVLLEAAEGGITVFNGETGSVDIMPWPRSHGIAYFFTSTEDDFAADRQRVQRLGWFRATMLRFRPLVIQGLGVSFLLALLSIAVPLFVMGVYDKVVGTGSLDTLTYFAIGVSTAIVLETVLRGVRARILAFIGARMDYIIGGAILRHILYLAPSYTESATVGSQIARIKDFETVRDAFTGPVAVSMLDLPFVTLYVLVLFILGGSIAFVPLIALVAFALLGLALFPLTRARVAAAAKAGSQRQEFLVEALSKMRALKFAGAEAAWLARFRDYSANTAMASFRTSQISTLIQTLSQIVIVASGIATIGYGVIQVLDEEMSMGGLIAAMILVWRVLGPLQALYLTITKIEQVRSSIKQIDGLMTLTTERELAAKAKPVTRFNGRVTFSRVSFRYTADADPAVVGTSFTVEPGEVCVIAGANASGKSTIFKLLLGLYQPQAGAIAIDNHDIRQLDPIELRHAISYSPQGVDLYHGTIAQNLRLANPVATEEELRWAAEKAGVLDTILALPDGFDTRLGDGRSEQMSGSLTQALSLARAYVKRAPIMLFDEPVTGLDFEGDEQFTRVIEEIRGNCTVFIISHRPSHFKMADKILWLEDGYLRLAGPADEVRAQMDLERI
jgi:ATP-binding cassette subfamily C protein/ATP-binding cassette subfamily C protein LapB